MSRGAYATISYAAIPEDDYKFPWDIKEYNYDIDAWWKKNKEGKCPYEVSFIGDLGADTFSFLSIKKSVQTADEWSPRPIDLAKMMISTADVQDFKTFCKEIKVADPKVAWYISANIG